VGHGIALYKHAGSHLPLTTINEEIAFKYRTELDVVPGLELGKAILTCVGELNERAPSDSYLVELLSLLSQTNSAQPIWPLLSTERRAQAILAIVSYHCNHGTKEKGVSDEYYGDAPVPASALSDLLKSACGVGAENRKTI
jgi:hypothetical protein